MPESSPVYVVRHGQTRSNLVGRYAGGSDEPLTEVGKAQIGELALRLRDRGVAEIWTSEIARARETAEILAEDLKAPVIPDPRLNEMVMGPWEGLLELEVASQYPEAYALWQERPDLVSLPERESLAMVERRIVAALGDAARRSQPVLLVTHVAPMRVAALSLLGLPLRHYKEISVSNAECFVAEPDRGDIRRLASTDSLSAKMPAEAAGPPPST